MQVGDPFMEKLLIECTLEIFAAGLVAGIQDLGGAGLSCATSELASAGDGGMHVELDRVPLRDSTLAPEEILMSESQERMMAVVEPDDVAAFMAICAKWDVEAVVVGEVTDTGRLHIDWHGERVVDVPPRSVAHDGPTYHRPFARPDWQDDLQADAAERLPRPSSGAELRDDPADAGRLARTSATSRGSPTSTTATSAATPCSRSPVRQRHDPRRRRDQPRRRGRRPTATAASRLLDPYAGAQLALAESYRNVATGGATPLAISDCLNFGSPEDPAVMWQFAEACRGLKDACARARHPGHRRQRQPLQPDRRDRDPADPGRRGARRDPGRHPSYAVGVVGRR